MIRNNDMTERYTISWSTPPVPRGCLELRCLPSQTTGTYDGQWVANNKENERTHRLALSLSISLLSTSSAVSSSNTVRNSSASVQSRHALFNVFGPRPSFGALPQLKPNPVLSFTIASPPRSRCPSSGTSLSALITPHSMTSFLCFTNSSWTACAIKGAASPDNPSSIHSFCENVSGVKGDSRSHSMRSTRWWLPTCTSIWKKEQLGWLS